MARNVFSSCCFFIGRVGSSEVAIVRDSSKLLFLTSQYFLITF